MNDVGVITRGGKEARVGVRADLLGIGGGVEASLRLPITTVGLSGSLDEFMAKLRDVIEPLWNGARSDAALNAFHPDCTDKLNGCPCFFWRRERQQDGELCGSCSSYREILKRVRSGGGVTA